jgi:DNA-directed RNA polymerase specialized sigma24 family protein
MGAMSRCQSLCIQGHDQARPFPPDGQPPHREASAPEGGLPLSLHHWPLDALLQEARRENSGQGQGSRLLPPHGATFEVLRRALLLRDEAAWAGLYQLYTPLVQAWILLHSRRLGLACEREELVNETFAKFAAAISTERWQQFPDTCHLLAYLKRCATTVVVDAGRNQQRRTQEVPLETLDHEQSTLLDDPAEVVSQHLVWHDFWRVMGEAARSQQERLLVQQHFGQGVPLRELARRYPDLFPRPQSIHALKKNLLRRLRQNRAVQQAAGLVGLHPCNSPGKR